MTDSGACVLKLPSRTTVTQSWAKNNMAGVESMVNMVGCCDDGTPQWFKLTPADRLSACLALFQVRNKLPLLLNDGSLC